MVAVLPWQERGIGGVYVEAVGHRVGFLSKVGVVGMHDCPRHGENVSPVLGRNEGSKTGHHIAAVALTIRGEMDEMQAM